MNKIGSKLIWMSAVLMAGGLTALAEVPRPEHPRPDLCRENWLTLNGEWQFEIDKAADGEACGLTYGKDLNSKIAVPFCPESKLSGLGLGNTMKLKDVWYRRSFGLPPAMKPAVGRTRCPTPKSWTRMITTATG